MIDISWKGVVERMAEAEGKIFLRKETLERVKEGKVEKGNVFETARVVAFTAVKKTWETLPHCHNIPIDHVKVDFLVEDDGIRVKVLVKSHSRTGVEMEALSGVSAALLCVGDMVKMYEKDETGNYPDTRIGSVRVVFKRKES